MKRQVDSREAPPITAACLVRPQGHRDRRVIHPSVHPPETGSPHADDRAECSPLRDMSTRPCAPVALVTLALATLAAR